MGNSNVPLRINSKVTVHPHACGELAPNRRDAGSDTGSSPRMWGTLDLMRYARQMCRFIPTHVGNSRVNLLKKMLVTVHPHACGELERMMKKLSICVGSSPRMWGTQVCRAAHRGRQRFIPTHVGNSPTGTGPLPRRPVHPHACGELGVARHPAVELLGSSPRMWGTPRNRSGRSLRSRFIPTHVGNSLPKTAQRS